MTAPTELLAICPASSAAAARAAGLETVTAAGLAAVLSPVPRSQGLAARLTPRKAGRAALRAWLLARQQHLETLHGAGDVLPAAGGNRIDAAGAVRLLRLHDRALTDQLARLAGKEQVQIRIGWDVAAAPVRFADDPAFLGAGIAGLRDSLAARMAGRLAQVLEDSIAQPPNDAAPPLLDIAGLVLRRATLELDRALEEIDALWPEGLGIRLIGPGPAAAFAALYLDIATPREIAAARALLDVRPAAAPAEIEAARRNALRGAAQSGAVVAQQRIARAAEVLLTATRAETEATAPPLPLVRILRADQALPAAREDAA